ncbi:MAG: hypothetical protein MIN69_00050 [Methylorubrum extorquens]|jgi:hypothetical protein|uniref:hypothetical protein n=1 Tax=Methylorubrum extorquens TaxID=408 RepID=UPI002FEE4796
MSRPLTAMACVLAFATPFGLAWLQAWPLLTTRPLPTNLDADAALLAMLILLCSVVLTALMSARIRSA